MPHLSPTETAMLETIDQAAMLSQVERWAAINSGSSNLAGLSRVAGELADAFSRLPGHVRLLDPASVEKVDAAGKVSAVEQGRHLVVSVRPQAPLRMLFTGHMDTVFGADHSFQALHWIDDATLGGPGVADMKGGIAVMLAALSAVEAAGTCESFGYDVLINSDEEVGSPSSAALIAELARGKIAALTYEPSALPDGTLAGARGGSGNFSLTVSGKSAHAGRNPDDGRNAIVAVADLALRLKALHRAGLSVNPARIDGGGPNNVVPDHAILRVNFRPATPDDENEADAALVGIVADIAREHDVEIGRHGGFGRPPKPVDETAMPLFRLIKDCGADLGFDIGWKATGGVCDGNNIAACGVPVVDTMGVRGGAIHSPQEYMIVDSLSERAALSALAIRRIIAKGAL